MEDNREQLVLPDEQGEASMNWSALFSRAVDDISKIIEAEIHLFEARFSAAVLQAIRQAITAVMMSAAMLVGGLCVIASMILLLHQWLAWWLAFGIVGAVVLIAGVTIPLIVSPRPTQ